MQLHIFCILSPSKQVKHIPSDGSSFISNDDEVKIKLTHSARGDCALGLNHFISRIVNKKSCIRLSSAPLQMR